MTRLRSDVWGLGAGWNDVLRWYALGVRSLQSRPLSDPTSWRFLAAIHGFHPQVWRQFGALAVGEALPPEDVRVRFWDQCQHQSWYFLPWHRGYLAAFEEIVRSAVVDAGGPTDWALPYWNYSDTTESRARELPEAFDLPTLPDGSTNPLRIDRRYGSGVHPIEIDPALVGLGALQESMFKGGVSDIPPGFGGPETLFHHGPESDTTNGSLEAEPHNGIHGAIGGVAPGGNPDRWQDLGLMSMPITAGLDPIFWLHHANIDRLWTIWRRGAQHQNPGEAIWLVGPADRQFVMPRSGGLEWKFAARDVLDTTAAPLDYRYEDETPLVVEPRAIRRLRRLGVRTAAPERAGGGEELAMSIRKTPELIGASDGAVHITGATSAAVQLDSSAMQSLRNSLARLSTAAADTGAEPARVFLKLEGIRGTSDAAIYRIYLDLPPNADPANYPDRLAGNVSLFGVSAASDSDGPNAGSGISQVLEITEIVDALHLSGDDLERIEVRFVPINAAIAQANISIGRLSVFMLGE